MTASKRGPYPEDALEGQRRIGEGAWKLVAVSVTGKAHSAREQGNEDAIRCARLEDGTLLLALADGAGSASNAAEGSRLAVDVALDSLSRQLALCSPGGDATSLGETLRSALREVRTAVATRLREFRTSDRQRARDLASTLLLAILEEDALAVLQVGDGAIVARDEEGWRRITAPLKGTHAGETLFATSRGAYRQAEVECVPVEGVSALALLSDGLEPVATDLASGEPHAPFFDPLASFVLKESGRERLEEDLEAFLSSERVQERSPDDLSLILAVRRIE